MTAISDFRIHFRIEHPSKPAQEIVSALSLVPSIVHSVGEPKKNHSGSLVGGKYERTYLAFNSSGKEFDSFEACLQSKVEEIRRDEKVIKDLIMTGGGALFYISIFCNENAGFEIDQEIMAELAEKKIALAFDIYPEVKNDPEQ